MINPVVQQRLDQLRDLLHAKLYTEVAIALTELAEPLFWHGATQTLISLFEQIPPEERNTHPSLLIAVGDAWRLHYDLHRAGVYYQQAFKVAEASEDLITQACALCRQALLCWRRGDTVGAVELYERASNVLQPVAADHTVWDDFNNGYALALSSLGQLAEAEQLLQRQLRVFQRRGDLGGQRMMLHNLGIMIYLRRGDFQAAESTLREALCLATASQQRHGEAYVLNSLAYTLNSQSRSSEALSLSRQAQVIGEELLAPNVIAYACFNQAYALYRKGELQAAESACQQALAHVQSALSSPLRSEILLLQAQLQQEHNPAYAYQIAQRALAAARLQDDLWTIGLCLLSVARLCIRVKQYDQARDALQEACTLFERYGDRYNILQCHLLTAHLAQKEEQWSALSSHVQALLVYLNPYPELATESTDLLFELLISAIHHDPETITRLQSLTVSWGNTFKPLMRKLLSHPDEQIHRWASTILAGYDGRVIEIPLATQHAPLAALSPTIPTLVKQTPCGEVQSLELSCLGSFAVRQNGSLIPRERWTSLHAQLVLVYLAQRGSATRDELIELLWPDEELDKTSTRFRSTMRLLRQALYTPSEGGIDYIIYQNKRYTFAPLLEITSDMQQFQHWIRSARQQHDSARHNACKQALSYYHGEFLPGSYNEWVIRQREHLAEDWLWAKEEYATGLMRHGRFNDAEVHARRVISADPLRERAWRLLIQTLRQQGRTGEALRMYQTFVQQLHDQFGIEPDLETRRLVAPLLEEHAGD